MVEILRRTLAGIAVAFVAVLPLSGQTGGMRVAIGAEGGAATYLGTFDASRFSIGVDAFLRWNIIPELSLHGVFGTGQLRYAIDDETIARFPAYFGTIPDRTYAADRRVSRGDYAAIDYRTYSALVSWNILSNERAVPFLYAGVGALNFDPKNDRGAQLPNNAAGLYDQTVLTIPVGVGLEYYAADNLTINGKVQLDITSTDWLDDLAENGTSNDAFGFAGIGLSYYFYGSLDCDRDRLTDAEEQRVGTDPCNPDTDADGLGDYDEVRTYGTDPGRRDSDDDGLTDPAEIRQYHTDPINADSDSDGLRDGEEITARHTDPNNPDSDGDQLTDGDEVARYTTDPTKADTDGDGLTDGDEVKVYATNPVAQDTDGDGLTDGMEVTSSKTSPKVADTDDDGLNDGDEVNTWRTDPKNPDTDNDKLTDGEEVSRAKTDPLNRDTDGDTVIDGDDACPLVAGVIDRNGCPAPPRVGTITNFPAIYFVVNTDEFDFSRPETDESLTKLLAYINQCPGLGVIVEGHASREGTETRNQELSDLRAKKVKTWLIERGADPSKIEATIGYGSRQNAVSEPDPKSAEARRMDPKQLEETRRQNRRIAVKVVRTCD